MEVSAVSGGFRSFNEAAVFQPRKRILRISSSAGSLRFNEAAVFQPRKQRRFPRTAEASLMLQ